MVLYFVFYTTVAFAFALLEIQIEGKHGWAKKLPTWRLYRPWFRYLPGANKPLTGYHLYLWILLFLLIHTPYLFVPARAQTEFMLLSGYIYILRLEDFFWFVLNPHFGLKNFRKERVPWHENWVGPLPVQYYVSIILWVMLLYLGLR